MRYLIRQKVFSFGDNFTIKNEYDEDCFIVRGKVFSFGDKLRLYNMNEQELFYIEQKLFKFLPEYNIYSNGQDVAKVKKDLAFFRQSFSIQSIYGDFSIDGNVFAHDFSIYRGGAQIAIISKKWFSFSDSYGVDIDDGVDHAFILALVIVLDQVLHDSNHSNNNN